MNDIRKPTSHIPPFGLRLQPELRDRIAESANAAGRSMNAEIVARLEASLAADDRAPGTLITKIVELSSMQTFIEGLERLIEADSRDDSDPDAQDRASKKTALLEQIKHQYRTLEHDLLNGVHGHI